MYHSPSKRVLFWRRIIMTIIMAIIVLAGVAVLTAFSLGYEYSEKDGTIEQGGILQLGSKPSGATVTINGSQYGSRTTTKLVSQPGEYNVAMDRTGYRTWQKTVPIQAGNITWLAYPRLIPERLEPQTVAEFPATMADALASPSGKKYAVLPRGDTPAVSTIALNEDQADTNEYTLPSNSYTVPTAERPTSQFEIDSWNGDENKLLIKHLRGEGVPVEWIVFDMANPTDSVNLNSSLGVGSLEKPVFSEGDGSQLFAIVDGAVRVLDLDDQTLGRPMVQDVVDFRLYGDKFVLFVKAPKDDVQQVGYVKNSYEEPRILRTVAYDGAHNAQLDVGKYYSKYYFLVSYGKHAQLWSSPRMPDDATSSIELTREKKIELDRAITEADVTDNGQFAIVQNGQSFATYNLEISQLDTTKLTAGDADLPQKLRHLDTYLLWGTRDGMLRTYEFDGANQQDIMPITPRLGATLSPDGKYLYGFTQRDDTLRLTRVQLLDITIN